MTKAVSLPSYGVSVFDECGHICRRVDIYVCSSLFRLYSFLLAVLHTEQQARSTHTSIKSAYKNERILILRQRISFGPDNEHKKEGLACKIRSGVVMNY